MKQFVWITTLFLTLAAPALALADRVGWQGYVIGGVLYLWLRWHPS